MEAALRFQAVSAVFCLFMPALISAVFCLFMAALTEAEPNKLSKAWQSDAKRRCAHRS